MARMQMKIKKRTTTVQHEQRRTTQKRVATATADEKAVTALAQAATMTMKAREQLAQKMLFGTRCKTRTRTMTRMCVAMAADPTLFMLMVKAIASFTYEGKEETLAHAEGLLDPETERIYSPGAPVVYNSTQNVPYHKPSGWVRWNVAAIDKNDACFTWSVGYHGTSPSALLNIADQGLISPADRNAASLHGQAGTTAETTNKTLYTSPCIGYSAHPVYCPVIQTSGAQAAQVLLQVRVDQNKLFNKLPSTLGKQYWPPEVTFEPGFKVGDTMEWLTTHRDAVKVTGVMFREMGHNSEEARSIYSEPACSFKATGDAPQFKWTKHLAAALAR